MIFGSLLNQTKGNTMRKQAAARITGNVVPEPMMDVNMTPLIDVMLVLIIMLIITIPKQNHAIDLSLSQGGKTTEVKPLIVNIDVDFDGTISWNGAVMASRKALETRLLAVAASGAKSEVHVRPNKLAPYKHVAAVMALTRRSGVTNMGVVGNEQFM